jgi:glycosyltransferase involved in cell wall biosynthesis
MDPGRGRPAAAFDPRLLTPRRILHLTDRLTDRGGAYWHLAGIVAAQVEAGHHVWLAGGSADGAGGQPRLRWPCPTSVVPGLSSRTRMPVALDALAAAFEPDVVHVHTVTNPEVLEWAADRRGLATVQDHRYFCPAQGKWTLDGHACGEAMRKDLCAGCFEDGAYFDEIWQLTRERLDALRRFRTVVVLSEYMRRELVAAGLVRERVHVIAPFVHGLERGAVRREPDCVLFAGRLTESKGVAAALAAWRQSRLGLPLIIAGTGRLRPLAEQAGAQVLGWVEHVDMAAVYQRAAALLMPSRWQEPFGISGLEALTLGTPVVAWKSGGIEEWHPGGESLVEWGDEEALARALRITVGTGASAPAGFDRGTLMARLDGLYARLPA